MKVTADDLARKVSIPSSLTHSNIHYPHLYLYSAKPIIVKIKNL